MLTSTRYCDMSREILEKALNKTNELEKKEMKRQKAAEAAGRIIGIAVALAADATFVWLVVKFMIGVSSFTWLGALGVMLLANLAYGKFSK